ncbi:UDP pyrophosphate phosphatase [Streptomyces albus subsp. albus]|nr:UDP pyrophosphate phosphatase [Streptomyces albus subsp. albus]
MSVLTYPEAIGIGLLQGVTELFPVSSLGHSILLPALLGGSWGRDLDVSAQDSPYLTVLIGLRLATTLALAVEFRREWARVLRGLGSSVRRRRIRTADEKLAWLLIAATVPVGVAGIFLEGLFRSTLARPEVAAVFLMLNGLLLFATERARRDGTGRRRRVAATPPEDAHLEDDVLSNRRIAKLGYRQAAWIGATQIAAFLPGVSRAGVTICAGIFRGLSHEDAARFAFLLATPVIGGAALYKMPALLGSDGAAMSGQIPVASAAAFVAGYAAVHFLTKYFKTHTLMPFAVYCSAAGLGSLVYLTLS